MPVADPSFGWQDAAAAFAIIAVVAFLVTWVVTDLGHVSRTPYVAILALTTFALAGGYLAWSGTSVPDLVATAGPGASSEVSSPPRCLCPSCVACPRGTRPEGAPLVGRLLWEGVVYGTAEAILLATLPVLAIWQATDALGWTDTTWAKVISGALAVVGALFVIAVHHLGYREFRQRASRKMLAGALVGCGIQALAFLLTGNVLAPVVAHIVLHWQLTLRGNEMPPVAEARLESPSARSAADRGHRAERSSSDKGLLRRPYLSDRTGTFRRRRGSDRGTRSRCGCSRSLDTDRTSGTGEGRPDRFLVLDVLRQCPTRDGVETAATTTSGSRADPNPAFDGTCLCDPKVGPF